MNNCSDLKEKGYKIILTWAHIKIGLFFFQQRTGNSESAHSLIFQTQNLENSQETPSIGRRPETSTSSCKDARTVFRTLCTGVCGGRDRARGRVNVPHHRWEPCGYILAREQARGATSYRQACSAAVQSLGVQLFVTLWTAAHQASLSPSLSWSLLKLMSIEL